MRFTAGDLASNAVTSAKIANDAVSNPKLAKNSVTSTEVKDHSLYKQDFAPGQIPAGPAGPQGPRGPAGTVGKLTLQSSSTSVGASNSSEVSVLRTSRRSRAEQTWSDKGDHALTLVYSNPLHDSSAGKATGWVARGRNATSKSRTFIVQVHCGNV